MRGRMSETLKSKMTAIEAANFLRITVQAVHKKLKNSELESYKSKNRVYFGHKTSKNLFKIDFKKKVISFQIVKGGVGKTSLSHSFAIRANLYGARVLCIDLDQQGNLTRAFNCNADEAPVMIDLIKSNLSMRRCIINIDEGLDLLPSRIENATLDNLLMLEKQPLDRLYNRLIDEVREDYDVIVFDCPPALGQSVAAATLASDFVVAAVTPEQFSLNALEITFNELRKINSTYGKSVGMRTVINKFDNRNALSSEVLSSVLNDENVRGSLCKSFIRICQEFPNTIYANTNIFNTLRNSSAREDIDLFTRELLDIDTAEVEEKVA